MEKYAGGYGNSGKSNSLHNFVGSLEQLGVADIECIFFDEYFHAHGGGIDPYLMSRLGGVDVVFFTYLFHCPFNPAASTLFAIKNADVKVVCAWTDFCKVRVAEYEDAATLNLVIDSNTGHDDEKFMSTFTPQDPRIYCDRGLVRDLDVSFVGSPSKPERRMYLNRLQQESFFFSKETSLQHAGSTLSPEDYASVMQRSKISLNFSRAENNRKQFKGRALEVMHCNAMLLSDRNEEMDRYLTAGEDYVVFDHPEDLVDKCKYYLSHEEERLKIASTGHKKVIEKYNNKVFWTQLFKKIGIYENSICD